MSSHFQPTLTRAPRRGAAALIVVMLLFFVMSLVAGYANRNVIFEQRTAANQMRSTLSSEVAEAAVQWTLGMLNTGLVDATCTPVAHDGSGTQTSFRQRYLDIDAGSGAVTPQALLAAGSRPTCVADGGGWRCSCPSAGAPVLAAPPADVVSPAFRVRFLQRPGSRPGTVWLEVQACTRLDESCLIFPGEANYQTGNIAGDARSRAEVMVALKSALPAPPVAALTVRGSADYAAQSVQLVNASSASGAPVADRVGGAIASDASVCRPGPAGAVATPGPAGCPPTAALKVAGDPDLQVFDGLAAGLRGDRFFGASVSLDPQSYRQQPATVEIDCGAAACDETLLRPLWLRNPGRILWTRNGSVSLAGAAIGSVDNPLLLVVEGGDLTLGAIQLQGLVVAQRAAFTLNGGGAASSIVRGAVVATGDFRAGGGHAIVHDTGTLERLRWQTGSFVAVPGSWKDF